MGVLRHVYLLIMSNIQNEVYCLLLEKEGIPAWRFKDKCLRSWFLKEPINLWGLDCNPPSYYTLLPELMLNKMSSFEEAYKHHPSKQGHSQGNWIRKCSAGGNAWTCAITALANEENPLLYAKSLRVANQTDSSVATGINNQKPVWPGQDSGCSEAGLSRDFRLEDLRGGCGGPGHILRR